MKKYIVHTKDGIIRILAHGMTGDDHNEIIRFFVGNEMVAVVSIANVVAIVEEQHWQKK